MAPVDGQPDAAVLGQAPLGDVHLRHDLHARDRAARHPPRDGGGVVQHPVDAEAHAQLAPVGRQVDVGGALLDRLRDDLVDQLDDRRVVGGLAQVDDLGGVALFLLLDLAVLLGDDVLEPVQARDQVGDVLRRGDRDAHLVAGHDRDVVDRQHVRRIGHRDQQRASCRRTPPAPPDSAWRRRSLTRLAALMSTEKTPRSRWSSP